MFSIVGKMLKFAAAPHIGDADEEKRSKRCEINEVNHDAVIIAHAVRRRELNTGAFALK